MILIFHELCTPEHLCMDFLCDLTLNVALKASDSEGVTETLWALVTEAHLDVLTVAYFILTSHSHLFSISHFVLSSRHPFPSLLWKMFRLQPKIDLVWQW